jgi:uncharacterized glyoxalase superfamily protein PhnB
VDDGLSSEDWDATTPSAAEPAPPETPPSVDHRPTQRLLLPAQTMRIGRTPDNDLILADLDVSRHHAELRKSPTGSYEIVDLGSHNGTFVNGKRVSRAMLTEHDIVNIGHSTFRLAGDELWQFVSDGTIHSTTGLLVYDDVNTAHDYIVRVFGLTSGHVELGPDGNVGYREVRAGDQVIGLHPAISKEFRSPRSLGAVTAMTVIAVDDADAHYARSVQAGAEIIVEPIDQPYGIREYGARDPEGQL